MKKPTMKTWFVARASLVAASLFFAAFAVYYWASPLWTTSQPLAIAIGLGFLVSAVVTPTIVPKLAHAKGSAWIGLVVVCVVFGLVDTLGVTGAFSGLEKDLTQVELDQANAVYQANMETASAALATAQTKLDAIPLPSATGEIRTRETWLAVTGALTEARNAAQDRVDTLIAPVRADLFDDQLVMILSALIQIAIAIGLLAVEAARKGVYIRDIADWEAAKAKADAERAKRAKAKAKTEPKPRVFTRPKLVANDA